MEYQADKTIRKLFFVLLTRAQGLQDPKQTFWLNNFYLLFVFHLQPNLPTFTCSLVLLASSFFPLKRKEQMCLYFTSDFLCCMHVSMHLPYLAVTVIHEAPGLPPPSIVPLFLHVASRRCFSHSNDSVTSTLASSFRHCFHPIKKVDLLLNLFDEFLDGNCVIMIKSGNHSKDDWLCNESWDK